MANKMKPCKTCNTEIANNDRAAPNLIAIGMLKKMCDNTPNILPIKPPNPKK